MTETYTKLYCKENGDSDFSKVNIELTNHPSTDLAQISKNFNSSRFNFLRFKAGAMFENHTAPCKQFLFFLKGSVEIEVSSGEKMTFNSGHFLYVEDTKGVGHITRVGDSDVLIAVCPVDYL